MATVFLLITLQVVVELGKFEGKKFKNSHLKDGRAEMEAEPLHLRPFFKRGGLTLNRKRTLAADGFPIMLWWSPLTGENGRLGQCGADACFFTINRTYLHHHRTKAFLFYGRSPFPGETYRRGRLDLILTLLSSSGSSLTPFCIRDLAEESMSCRTSSPSFPL